MANPKPIIVISYPHMMSENQYKRVSEVMAENLSKSGWHILLLDGCGEHKVQAFGLPNELLPEFIELKKLVYDNIKAR
jgi:hypothetical protein